MRKGGPLIGVGVVSLAMALPAQAVAEEVCCYRVHVNTSNTLHVEDHGGTGAGAQNGAYDLSSQWAVRELMIFNSKRYGDAYFDRVRTRNQNEVRGKVKFEGSESSDQWHMAGSPPTRVDYGPCRYAMSVPWHRTDSAPRVMLERGGGAEAGETYLRAYSDVGAAEYQGACDNTAPFYGHLSGWASGIPGHESYWDALSTSINVSIYATETRPRVHISKLKKMKDQVVTLEPPRSTQTSQVDPHTYTLTHRTVVRITWFPYDRLQKELNEFNALR